MGRKGRKQKRTGSASRDASGDASQQQSGVSQQRPVASQQQPGGPQQRPAAPEQQRPSVPQQQRQPAWAPRQQQPGITPQHSVTPQQQSGVSQQRPVASQQQPGGPQQRPAAPEQQRPGVPQQQRQPAWGPRQQQPGITPQHSVTPQQQSGVSQQRPVASQQQPGGPQQRPAAPGQQRPGVPQQQRPGVPQQQRPGVPQQQQQPACGPRQQQPGITPQHFVTPQQQSGVSQQRPVASQQQPGGPQQHPGVPQQQRPGVPQQQQQPACGPRQQQPGITPQHFVTPQQQSGISQQRPVASQQQPGGPQQRPAAPEQQRPGVPQQQQQPAYGPRQQQPGITPQHSVTPQQQSGVSQQRPVASQQQPGGPQQRPVTPQQQRPGVPQQQQQPACGPRQQQPGITPQHFVTPQQQSGISQQRPVASQQQPGGPQQRPAAPEQQRPGVPQQQQQPAYGPRQQQPGITPQHSVTPQQQSGVSQQRPVASQQQPGGPQQRPVTPQQQPISSKQLETPSKAFPPMDVVASSVLQTAKSQRSASLMQSYIDQIPKRKAPGTLGIPIQVETNMFRLIFDKNFETDVVHYDVDINPDRPKFLLRPVFEAFRKKNCPHRYPAYDGRKNAYSAKELPFGDQKEDEVEVFDKEREQTRRFAIKLTKAAVLDLSWFKKITPKTEVVQNAVQALDIILRHGPASQWITVGRSLFREEPGKVVSLSGGLDLWVGVFQSAIVGWRPYLNVDVAHKGFPTSQGVIDLMKELCQPPQRGRDPPQQPRDITAQDVHRNKEKINKYLKGLKIQYVTPGQSKRTQRVNGLGDSPRTLTFTLQNGSKCTVEQYFAQEKKYKIRFPDLPCIWIGSREKKIYVPPELCTIVAGQVVQRKMDEQQTSRMIKIAATDTTTRKEKILRGFESMKLNENPVMKNEFKLSVQGQFERVPARVLEPPKLFYDRVTNVSKGVWRAGKFKTAMDLEEGSWTILNLNGRYTYDRDLYVLHDRLQGGGGPLNMSIGKAQVPFTSISLQDGPSGHKIRNYFEEKKSQKLKLVIVVIPDFADAYSTVKQVTELHVGVLTQCIKAQTLRKLSDATVGNILLKINSKLNGINHVFEPTHRPRCLNTPCIIIGADVTHPSPDATDIPSIAAVAASHDPNAFQYNIEIRLQPPREEMIQDLEEIMRLQLIYFFKKTGHKPAKVIFYRDGVSEGQLPQVMHYELSAIKRAFQKLQANYNPLVTFIVVQKRHHIRLFPTNKRFSDDRNFNVQAGTIVDTDITHPSHIDFYLVSHASIQGTARPTKYRCISNENEQSEDEIEQLTYYLCHMFARCTRSVSYPAPTYYAHLAAFRARALTHNVPIDLGNLKEEQRRKMTLQVNAQAPMFFV